MSHYSEQFLKQNPLAVLGVLRDLQKGEVPLRISWSNNQFISKILDASQDRLVIDLGSQEYENRAALKAENIAVMAETQGAKVEFVLSRLELSEYQGLPAFVTPLPTNLWFVQRREYFRISAPLHPAYFCKAKMPDKKEIRFRLFDLSLGGMGALMDTPKPDGLVEGMRFTQIELDMGGWGRFYFDAQLIAISDRTVVDSKNETITTPRLSFRFLNVGPGVSFSVLSIPWSERRGNAQIRSCEEIGQRERRPSAALHGIHRFLYFPDITRRLWCRVIFRHMFKEFVFVHVVNLFYCLFAVRGEGSEQRAGTVNVRHHQRVLHHLWILNPLQHAMLHNAQIGRAH